MAISASAVWDVRSTATGGANVNGGFFVTGASGTDYSKQNGAQYALTGIASAGAGNVVLSASAAADMVGNGCHVISGTNFTTGWFEITSVSVGVSITFSTNVAGASICTGVGASGVLNIGGAMSLGGTDDDAVFEAGTAGNIYYVKNGTYTLGGTVSISLSSATNPSKIIGYNTTQGDNPMGSTRPLIDCGAATFTLGAGWQFRYMQLTSTAGTSLIVGTASILTHCKVLNTSTTANRTAISASGITNSMVEACEMVSIRGIGFATGNIGIVRHSYIHDCNIGINVGNVASSATINNCLIESCTSNAIKVTGAMTAPLTINSCTLYGSEQKTGDGINFITGATLMRVTDTIIYGFVNGIIHADASNPGYEKTNNYFNNTTNRTNWPTSSTSITLTPSFINAAQYTGTTATTASGIMTDSGANFANVVNNQDYLLILSGTGVTAGQYLITAHTSTTITTSPALANNATADKAYQITTGRNFGVGANMQAAAIPFNFPGGLSVCYMDLGSIQRQIDVPAVTNVLNGVNYDAGLKTGTYATVATTNVRSGTTFGAASALTGTLAVPAVANVLNGIAVDATTGTYVTVATGNVKTGVTYGPSSSLTGTYTAATTTGIKHVQVGARSIGIRLF